MKIHTTLMPEMPIHKFSNDIIVEFDINQNQDWVKDLLIELQEENETDAELPAATMHIQAAITNKTDKILGEYFTLKTKLDANFHLPCVRCLHPLQQVMNLELMAAFLHDSEEKKPEYQESTSVFADGHEMELYFYRKGLLPIKEFFHEQIFMEVNQFPRCAGECVGPILF